MEQRSFEGIRVVKAYAPWCQPCRIFGRTFHKVVNDMGIEHEELNVDEEEERAKQLGVGDIPETLVFRNNDLIARRVGAIRGTELKAFIEGAVA